MKLENFVVGKRPLSRRLREEDGPLPTGRDVLGHYYDIRRATREAHVIRKGKWSDKDVYDKVAKDIQRYYLGRVIPTISRRLVIQKLRRLDSYRQKLTISQAGEVALFQKEIDKTFDIHKAPHKKGKTSKTEEIKLRRRKLLNNSPVPPQLGETISLGPLRERVIEEGTFISEASQDYYRTAWAEPVRCLDKSIKIRDEQELWYELPYKLEAKEEPHHSGYCHVTWVRNLQRARENSSALNQNPIQN